MPFRNYLNALSVGQKISCGYALALGIAVFGTTMGSIVGYSYQKHARQLLEDVIEETILIDRLQIKLAYTQLYQQRLEKLVNRPNQLLIEYKLLKKYSKDLEIAWSKLVKSYDEATVGEYEDELEAYERLIESHDNILREYLGEVDNFALEFEENTQNEAEIEQFLKQPAIRYFEDNVNEFSQSLEDLNQLVIEEEEETTAYLDKIEKRWIQIIAISLSLSTAIAAILASYTSRAIARPIKTVTQFAQQATQTSNFTTEVSIVSQDEIGILADAFNQFVRQVNHLLQEQKQAQHAAEAANRAKSKFLANMSHELRTPLNAILGFTQVILRDEASPQEQRNYIEIVNRSGEHLLSLINDILEMSKIEAGKITLNPSSFDLYRLLNTLEDLFHLKAQMKDLQLLFERTPEVPQHITTDQNKLRQILINLLGNAFKFTQQGSVTLRVGVDRSNCTDANDRRNYLIELIFEVEDTGMGIASEEKEGIFEAFGQSESGVQSQTGTGLGLPISRKFVQLMGGELNFRSTLNGGSLFYFNLPVLSTQPEKVKPPNSKERVIGLAPNQPLPRILIVEDEPINRKLLVKLLTEVGLEVKEAENGQEAIAISQSWQPHFIWMDIRMPVMNGYQATQAIKADPQEPRPIIVALTAHSFEEERSEILEAGCDDFVRKPFQAAEIFMVMAKHLNLRYVYREQQKPEPPQISKESREQSLVAQLKTMPSEWIEKLEQTAIKGSDDEILQAIEKIPESNHLLRKTLRNWSDDFDFDAIIALIEQSRL
ncbi:response regulator [Lusitaniella coriacea LEGE 07157]|uniref:Circadian input-output histidine kinase CikA n=1 Tax=Lusitaniella coriacea LEGE 07157 TaxID=945747 RepID=A0A8J7E0A7_9CYAN|nr:response regulator [Lusitaniella coriacea]MBE9117888.1 response regulator [Lusitaniella coriacea LEGE 07157]